MTLKDKFKLIADIITKKTSKDPIAIVTEIMHEDFISIHGPEHHFLDGAAFLVAYKNAGGEIDLPQALNELAARAITMPGAMCVFWGVCGSTASLGASLAIINGTGPLSSDKFYKHNMEYTSNVIAKMSVIGGPRCCKRNAFLSIMSAVDFVNCKYAVKLDKSYPVCDFHSKNEQCLGQLCPFHR